ncbi:MAG: restriction endonuclease subunit S [Proteobacteria bacterium]|nr:restriction endonuclease subunit S [Pseudomonadota bacterium]
MARNSEVADLPLDVIGNFPIEWERSTLGKSCALVTDGTHDSPKESTTGFPLVTGKCITGGRVNLKAAYLISEQDHLAVVARSRPEVGDILFANIGNSIGELARVETSEEFSIKNVALFKPSKKLDGGYLKYYLLSPAVQSYIRGTTFGSAQPFIGLGTLRAFPIPLPKPDEQRAIAHILGTLDDKIELNRRMNETLEAIARAIFKSWFVDFDPVRAKASGEPPESICRRLGLTPDLLALFPDRLVDSELGEIPEGWNLGNYGNIVSQRTERVENEKADVLSAVASGDLVRSEEQFTKRVYSKEINKYLAVEQWDFAYNPSRINIGSIGMLEEPTLGAVSPVYVVARPHAAYRWFLRFHLELKNTKSWINTLASGSVRQSLSFKDFTSIPSVIPPESISSHFEEIWLRLRAGIYAYQAEMTSLAEMRDTLLPRLLSGELLVPVENENAEVIT